MTGAQTVRRVSTLKGHLRRRGQTFLRATHGRRMDDDPTNVSRCGYIWSRNRVFRWSVGLIEAHQTGCSREEVRQLKSILPRCAFTCERVRACNDIRRVFTTLWRHKLEILHIHFKLIRGGRSRERLGKKVGRTRADKTREKNCSSQPLRRENICYDGLLQQTKKKVRTAVYSKLAKPFWLCSQFSVWLFFLFFLSSFLPFFVSGAWLDLEGTIKLLFPRGALLSIWVNNCIDLK